jgi:hypothetical protein
MGTIADVMSSEPLLSPACADVANRDAWEGYRLARWALAHGAHNIANTLLTHTLQRLESSITRAWVSFLVCITEAELASCRGELGRATACLYKALTTVRMVGVTGVRERYLQYRIDATDALVAVQAAAWEWLEGCEEGVEMVRDAVKALRTCVWNFRLLERCRVGVDGTSVQCIAQVCVCFCWFHVFVCM